MTMDALLWYFILIGVLFISYGIYDLIKRWMDNRKSMLELELKYEQAKLEVDKLRKQARDTDDTFRQLTQGD